MTTPHTLDPGHDIFQALSALAPGAWKIKSDWKTLGFLSNNLAKTNGWVHVESDSAGSTSLMWTSEREIHHPSNGPARSLTINRHGQLEYYARSILSMHKRWARYDHADTVDDENYREALAIGRALHKAMVVDQRATLMPQCTALNTQASTTRHEPRQTPTPPRKGP